MFFIKNFNLLSFLIAFLLLSERAYAARTLLFVAVGRDFPAMDPLDGDPDAYLTVFYAYGSTGTFERVGNSLVIDNSRNPDWEDEWTWEFVPGAGQRLKFEIWDSDTDGDDLIGTINEIYFAELYNAEGGFLEKELNEGNGRLIFNITTVETSV